ncbi:MAG TPA: hypothetical protein VMX38_20930 [Verrucomicrobiae bacterium]|jgi:hypothetical protein|nr:hypothetical protein [Verrucomicrobiae bacterium]
MSDERRKRQQDRAGTAEHSRQYLKWGGIVLLFAAAYYAGYYYKAHKYDSFAKCLASKQAKMYGLYWCPHCAEQKQMFGASFHYVPYVECAIKGQPRVLAPECKAAGAKLFPSWQFGANPPKEGVLSLEELSEKTGCSLP